MLNKIIIRGFIETGYALTVTSAIGRWAVYYAHAERGYEAVGGEYILILFTYWTAYRAIHGLLNILGKEIKNAAKKRRGNVIRMQNHG